MLKYLNFLKDKRCKQAEAASQFLFTDIMTSDILVHFMRDKAFFRVAILSHVSCEALLRRSHSHMWTKWHTHGVF